MRLVKQGDPRAVCAAWWFLFAAAVSATVVICHWCMGQPSDSLVTGKGEETHPNLGQPPEGYHYNPASLY